MAQDFWVDHSDPPYPEIRHRSHPQFDDSFHEALTLSQAKDEIKTKCRQERRHWLAVMHNQVNRGVETIIRESIEARRVE